MLLLLTEVLKVCVCSPFSPIYTFSLSVIPKLYFNLGVAFAAIIPPVATVATVTHPFLLYIPFLSCNP